MREFRLGVKNWSAWVPGIEQCGGWRNWEPADLSAQPDLAFLAPMMRRRLSPASRLALKAAYDCLGETSIGGAIFCSRHGECQRTVSMYRAMDSGEGVSPTQFSQSVHNAAAGVFSIALGLQVPITALAAGPCSGEQGFIEAWSQIRSGMGPVLWVMADNSLDAPFNTSVRVPEFPFAVAMLLDDFPDAPEIVATRTSVGAETALSGTDNLLALLTEQERFKLQGDNGWRWELHGA